LPEDKLKRNKRLQAEGKLYMAATESMMLNFGASRCRITMGTGTDVAIESAKITLVKGDLQSCKAKNLSHAVMRNIKQNFFAFSMCWEFPLPLAFVSFFGVLLSPMIAALAMSFSSVSVIANASIT
jgi:Cu2+-exporting ATPase